MQLSELDEIRLEAYENSKLYKEKTKKFHDSMIVKKDFMVGCRNLPFGGRATNDSRDACSTKGIRAESPPMFI